MRLTRIGGIIALHVTLAGAPSVLWAQQAGARLRGTVTDATTSAPVKGARVILATTGRFVQSDSAGAFELRGLPSGIVRLFFSAQGFPRVSVLLAFASGETMVRRFELDSTAAAGAADTSTRRIQALAPAEIVATPTRGVRYADFERRMKTGRGQYITREQIEEAGYANLTQAVRTMRGVAVECGGTQGCRIRMARASQNCYPEYVVDGRVDNFFGPFVAIRDIEGMEVYTGASDVPGEFAGRNAGCGVVVIWTGAGPPKPAL